MGDFSQYGIVSTLHDFKTKSTDEIEKETLKVYSNEGAWRASRSLGPRCDGAVDVDGPHCQGLDQI